MSATTNGRTLDPLEQLGIRDITALAAKALNDTAVGQYLDPDTWQDYHQELITIAYHEATKYQAAKDNPTADVKAPVASFLYYRLQLRAIDIHRGRYGNGNRPTPHESLDRSNSQLGGRGPTETLAGDTDVHLSRSPAEARWVVGQSDRQALRRLHEQPRPNGQQGENRAAKAQKGNRLT